MTRSTWKPGCRKPHPDRSAIIDWAEGRVKLEVRHLAVQPSLTAESVWVPTDFPCFNPTTKEVRVRPEKMFTCTYYETNEGPEHPRAYVCRESEMETFSKTFPMRIQASEWVPYNVPKLRP